MISPDLSIVIPSYQQGQYIERTLLSILRQDYPGRLQIIVSDGGSKDGTVDILRRYGGRITWWSEKDKGIVDAINKGLDVATGEVLAIQSSDDWYLPGAFKLATEHLLKHPELGIVAGCDVYVEPNGSVTYSKLDDQAITPKSLLMERVIPQHCAFFRREVMLKVGMLRESIREGGEIDFWYRALHFYPAQFIPWHIAAYQLHPQQRTRTGNTWYSSMTHMVESCEADPMYGSRFQLTNDEKRNMYIRWQILQERMNGNDLRVEELVNEVMNSNQYTEQTRDCLRLHGLVEKPKRPRTAAHPNFRAPDLNWWKTEREAA